MSLFARTTFLPSLAYNLLKNRWSTWNWFDRIDDQLILGALPFHGPVTYQLYYPEKVRSVVSMNENFELQFAVTNQQDWNLLNVKFLQLNISDIFHAPKLSQLIRGVEFIEQQQKQPLATTNCDHYHYKRIFDHKNPLLIHWPIRNNGKTLKMNEDESIIEWRKVPSTYVHCKAGRTRSATLVACYLLKRYNQTPVESIRELQKLRPQILLQSKQILAIEAFHEYLLQNFTSTTVNGYDRSIKHL